MLTLEKNQKIYIKDINKFLKPNHGSKGLFFDFYKSKLPDTIGAYPGLFAPIFDDENNIIGCERLKEQENTKFGNSYENDFVWDLCKANKVCDEHIEILKTFPVFYSVKEN